MEFKDLVAKELYVINIKETSNDIDDEDIVIIKYLGVETYTSDNHYNDPAYTEEASFEVVKVLKSGEYVPSVGEKAGGPVADIERDIAIGKISFRELTNAEKVLYGYTSTSV